jgi:hypothetical protein
MDMMEVFTTQTTWFLISRWNGKKWVHWTDEIQTGTSAQQIYTSFFLDIPKGAKLEDDPIIRIAPWQLGMELPKYKPPKEKQP